MNEEIKKLPQEVQDKLSAYMERIKAIKWFEPKDKIDEKEVEQKVKFALECFGVKAELEWKKLETPADWGAARDAAWGAAWDAARGAAWGAAWGACDIVASDLETYKSKYPNGAFVNLIPLWELGLYPVGVVGGKFIIYIPPCKTDFPEIN